MERINKRARSLRWHGMSTHNGLDTDSQGQLAPEGGHGSAQTVPAVH